jgi:thioredoxin reductase (NADPH)
VITLSDDSEINCQALLIATGVSYRQLDIPGLNQLTGAGIYYGSAMTEESTVALLSGYKSHSISWL